MTFARDLYNSTQDRSYDYDHLGRLTIAYSGEDARAHVGIPGSQWGIQDGPYAHPNFYDVWGNITARYGWGGANPWFEASYTNNKRNGFSYNAAGNLTNDLGQTFTYDATGQQVAANYSGYALTDGDTLRAKKTEMACRPITCVRVFSVVRWWWSSTASVPSALRHCLHYFT